MIDGRRRKVKCFLVLMALLLAAAPLYTAQAHVLRLSQPVQIRVEINDDGFNHNGGGDFNIDVELGQVVELTFVWAGEKNPDDEHIFVVDGYNLKSGKINSTHRETTLKFVADKVGTFDFKCDIDCENHDLLQKGHLNVKAGSGGTGTGSEDARTPTSLAVTASAPEAGAATTLTAVLTDADGAPVPDVEVTFSADAEFVSTKGQMEVGKAKTNADGVATIDYQPIPEAQKITAHFEAVGLYGASQQTIEIKQTGTGSTYKMAPVGLENAPKSWALNHWGPLAILALVVGSWLVFGYVLYQVFGIARSRARR
jgi:hypothetical protein